MDITQTENPNGYSTIRIFKSTSEMLRDKQYELRKKTGKKVDFAQIMHSALTLYLKIPDNLSTGTS